MFGQAAVALTHWLDHLLKINVYEARRTRIVRKRGWRPDDLIEARDIAAWRIHAETGFDIVEIEMKDGRCLNWVDRYDDLIRALRSTSGDRELP